MIVPLVGAIGSLDSFHILFDKSKIYGRACVKCMFTKRGLPTPLSAKHFFGVDVPQCSFSVMDAP